MWDITPEFSSLFRSFSPMFIAPVIEPCAIRIGIRLSLPELCMKLMAQQPVVLLTESDAVVGMDLSDALEKAGYRVLGPVDTMAEALNLLEQERPTLAILDLLLRDGSCTALAAELRQRGVPFLIQSEHPRTDPLAPEFQDVPWLSKPVYPWDVVALCDELSLSV